MATRCKADFDKENRTVNNHEKVFNPVLLKNNDRRVGNVFGVLENDSKNIKTVAEKFDNLKKHANIKKHVTSKPIETSEIIRTFYVYEDSSTNENINLENKENVIVADTVKNEAGNANISTLQNRNPLCEILEAPTETPMSVDEMTSPMSIDKSIKHMTTIGEIASIPSNDRNTFFEVKEYQADILEYLKLAETRNRPKFNYMKKQPDITYAMRKILVDWLVEVCEEYHLHNETLYLAVSYIDRFLSFMSVVRAKLQLVGTAAMLLAAKYEEIYPPDIGEFVYITDDTYTKKQILRMEQLILKVLSFDLSIPTPMAFITICAVMISIPEKVKALAMYFCELSLLEADPFLQYLPSQISAAAIALAQKTLNLPIWTEELESLMGYNLQDLEKIIINLNHCHKQSSKSKQKAIQEKYKSEKYFQVSLLNPLEFDDDVEYITNINEDD